MKQYFRRIALGLALAVAACVLYWGQLASSQQTQLRYAEEQISFRATRLAEALAIQVNTLFSGLEYLATSLANAYMVEGGQYFPVMVQTAFRTFPRNSIVQVSIANARGELVYSSLRGGLPGADQLHRQALGSIADREHFRVHLENPRSKSFVSKPVFGRLSQRWTIQISQAMRRDGEFLGVVVLSVAPEYVSSYFREVFTSEGDTSALIYADGTYMARSSLEASVMDKKVPADRTFLHDPHAMSGTYRVAPELDPVERMYAWHRVADYPLIVSIGLERAAGLETLKRLQRASVAYSLIGTMLFLLFACWIAWLVARLKHDQLLQKEDARLREALFDNSAADILLIHPQSRQILSSNRHANQTFAPNGEPLAGVSASSLHINEASARRFEAIYSELQRRGAVQVEAPLRNGKGEERWYSINGTLLDRSVPDGEVIWTMLDITQRRQMEQSLADAWVRLAQVIEHFPGGVLVEDESGKILVINQRFCDLFHLEQEATSVMGDSVADLAGKLSPEDVEQLCAVLPMAGDSHADPFSIEFAYRDRMLHVTITRVQRGQISRGRLWVVEDVTARLKHESDLNRMATTDALTGLPNRAAFLNRLDAVLAAVPAPQRRGVLMMADLDRFKLVNDSYGHAAGDEVLRFLSGIFQSVLRQSDMAGRLGGEEFSVLLPDVDENTAWRVAERIRATLEASDIPTSAGVVRITISIGMAYLSAGEAAEILAAADAALYKAKRSGRNRIEAAWADV